jgi:hypothetical protein
MRSKQDNFKLIPTLGRKGSLKSAKKKNNLILLNFCLLRGNFSKNRTFTEIEKKIFEFNFLYFFLDSPY